ncbi:MAG: hypothetical protein ABI615_10495, partial [Chthoniobacterales bacterium]
MKLAAKTIFASCFCLALLCQGLQAQESKPKGTPVPPANAKPEEKKQKAKTPSGEPKIDIPIPIGKQVQGIKIPHYNEKGDLVMLFEAETAVRLDDSHIEMKNLKI